MNITVKLTVLAVAFAASALGFLLANDPEQQRGISEEQAEERETPLFCQDGKFKIMQITDNHFGESESADEQSVAEITRFIQQEKPGLIAMSGDIVSGYACNNSDDQWWPKQFDKAQSPMVDTDTLYAYELGNHDSEGNWGRQQIIDYVSRQTLSLTQRGPSNIGGIGNFVLHIYDSPLNGQQPSDSSPLWNVWFLDSGDYNCCGVSGYGCVSESTVRWYRETSESLEKQHGRKIPGIMYTHIPIPELLSFYNNLPSVGSMRDSGICCSSLNTGLFAAMVDRGDIKSLWHGHDHSNDFSVTINGITVGYGRKNGFGSYGPKNEQRGTRIIEVSCDGSEQWRTYIRQDDGTVLTPEQQTVNRPANWTQWVRCSGPGFYEYLFEEKH